MSKTSWVSLAISLVFAALVALCEQRRYVHYMEPHPSPLPMGEGERPMSPLPSGEGARRAGEAALSKFDVSLALFTQRLEWATQDARFKLRGKRKPTDQVVIIAIDDASLKELHQWPWPRSIHARL